MHEGYRRGGLWASLAATVFFGILIPYSMSVSKACLTSNLDQCNILDSPKTENFVVMLILTDTIKVIGHSHASVPTPLPPNTGLNLAVRAAIATSRHRDS
jgi:hypothetical protein